MLLSLPIELVERILCPPEPIVETRAAYAEQHASLRACCLVSSRLRRIAQPLLDKFACIDSPAAYRRFKTMDQDKRRSIKLCLVIKVELSWSSLSPRLGSCKNLRRLYLMKSRGLAHGVPLRPADVVELTFSPSGTPPEFVTSTSFPSLRRLATLFHHLETDIFEQLDAYVCIYFNRADLPRLSKITPARVLLSLSPTSPSSCLTAIHAPFPRYLHPQRLHTANLTGLTTDILSIPASDIRLPLLYLPTDCAPGHPALDVDTKKADILQGLYDACAARRIKVVWKDVVRGVLVDFSRRAEAIKADEATAA
ncbi:hypothetical protein JCM8097_004064 [Rhodosporidiobolus ruineniae]